MADQQRMKLAKRTDIEALRRRFDDHGRVHIPEIFHLATAKNVSACLNNDMHWNLVTDNNGRHLDLDASNMAAISNDNQNRFLQIVHDQARSDFQYLYKNYPVYDAYHNKSAPDHFLNQVFEFINGPKFIRLVRQVTGDETIAFADAQATCYEGGHFLTCHDDDIDGKNRCCAYVLNFTKGWRPDWGGALQFFDRDNHLGEAFFPTFNALNILRVPQRHSVSIVAPFAGTPRLSITGWLRAGVDPRLASQQPAPILEKLSA